MESLDVLEKEIEICDLAIEYKKENGEDYDTWRNKKDAITAKIEAITADVQNKNNFEDYKKKIKNQYNWESKLLIFVEKDVSLDETQKRIIIQRVNNRKKIIEEELGLKIDNEDKEKEDEKSKPKEEQSLNLSISHIPKEIEINELKRLTEVVTERLNEYRAALYYFQKNELSKQLHDATIKTKQISIELKKIQDGKWKEVDEFKLPEPVTPEYIYGCLKEERDKKFRIIISEYKNQIEGIKNDIKVRVEGFKKLSKEQFKKIESMAIKDIEGLKAKKEKIEKLAQIVIEKSQDKWAPSPLFVQSREERKIEKMNRDIPEFIAKIKFGKTTYKKDILYLIVKIPEYKFEKTFNQIEVGDWSENGQK